MILIQYVTHHPASTLIGAADLQLLTAIYQGNIDSYKSLCKTNILTESYPFLEDMDLPTVT